MRITAAIITGTAMVLMLSACGSGGDSSDAGTPLRPPPKVATLGPFVGECGHVTDDEVRDTARLGQISQVLKNSVGCNWQSSGYGSPSVTFASYRGSPIAREKAWVSTQGRNPQVIDVGGRSGWQALEPDGKVCDLAVQLDDDFFEWSMSFGAFPPDGNPCDRMHKLAELTVQRLK
ncbi:DUF3558 domain-containing protein [Nocardia brasiliensis]|uniref:DUF3558 domain-containing protein n=1 Tax=Nocardia brasiliensis TaxID=37326 RepID=UPI0018932A65|nr:DUF3558 domain-containing protein [Nocardia brasiliensis]MBF6124682.1 DUF3558 domain-containing protein [Nocardia brasiliensis]MBF6546086.1 DUF3558 domain-containing protein [Nocardia brasiliensis]